ncbi:MAG: TonB-dependent receptor [bacterium]
MSTVPASREARTLAMVLGAVVCCTPAGAPAESNGLSDLAELSLEDLLRVEVVSVSKKEEAYFDTAAATYVLTSEDIARSGATSLPEALRAVPGLQVARVSSSDWAIAARGFNGVWSNKLLVMVDGRTVFSPLFSQVFWDAQELPLDQIERIEVVRGPGGAMWGANAVNGVINVITKPAQGKSTIQAFRVADQDLTVAAQLTQQVPLEDGGIRGYLRYADRTNDALTNGEDHRIWDEVRGGFRIDYGHESRDEFLLTGAVQKDQFAQHEFAFLTLPSTDATLSTSQAKGAHVLGRYTRNGDRGVTTVQAYYDRSERYQQAIDYVNDTYDLEIRSYRDLGEHSTLNVGAGARLVSDVFTPTAVVEAVSPERSTVLWNVYAQGERRGLDGRLRLVLGAKIEESSTSGLHVSPTARLAHRVSERQLVWAAASRAVTTPSRTMRDFTARLSGSMSNGTQFQYSMLPNDGDLVEKVTAYELGYRIALTRRIEADLAVYRNDYTGVLGTQLTGPPTISFGPDGALVEVAAQWQIGSAATTMGTELALEASGLGPFSLVRSGYSYFHLSLDSAPSGWSPLSVAGSTPSHQVFASSTLGVRQGLLLDSTVRWVSPLDSVIPLTLDEFATGAHASLDAYFTLDAAVRWSPLTNFSVALGGRNLVGPDSPEFQDVLLGNSPHEVGRVLYTQVRWGI